MYLCYLLLENFVEGKKSFELFLMLWWVYVIVGGGYLWVRYFSDVVLFINVVMFLGFKFIVVLFGLGENGKLL